MSHAHCCVPGALVLPCFPLKNWEKNLLNCKWGAEWALKACQNVTMKTHWHKYQRRYQLGHVKLTCACWNIILNELLYWPFKTSCLNTHATSNHSSRAALCERLSPTVACVRGKNQSILAHSHKEAENYNTQWGAKDVFAFSALQRNLNLRGFSAVERPKLNNGEGPLKVPFNLANFSR